MSSDPPEQPPHNSSEPRPPSSSEPPPETEEYLDWLENQSRDVRRARDLDVWLISASALGTAVLIVLIVLLVRHVRR